MDNAVNLVAINAICVWLIQIAKSSKFVPFLTSETEKANKLISALLSAFAAAGMTISAVHIGSGGSGTLTITYGGFTLANIVAFGYHWIGYYATQKGLFKILCSSNTANADVVVHVNPQNAAK